MTSKVPCKFFERGYCKNGDSCRFSHKVEQSGKRFDDYNEMGTRELALIIKKSPGILKSTGDIFMDFLKRDIKERIEGLNRWSKPTTFARKPAYSTFAPKKQSALRSNVPCRFYLRGYCQYGKHCSFSHENVEADVFKMTGRPMGEMSNGNFRVQDAANISATAFKQYKDHFVDSLIDDMKEWNDGKFWPLVTQALIPGNEDLNCSKNDTTIEQGRAEVFKNKEILSTDLVDKIYDTKILIQYLIRNHRMTIEIIDKFAKSLDSNSLAALELNLSSGSDQFIAEKLVVNPESPFLKDDDKPEKKSDGHNYLE